MAGWITRWWLHPATAALDVDDPETTSRRREIIRGKRFLRRLYAEWYDLIRDRLPAGPGDVVELGSGAGFMKERIPGVITTDVLRIEGVDVVLPPDGRLPFADGELRAIVMTNVLHHIPAPRTLFREAARTVGTGGAMVMIEPWVTPWSSFVYRHLHPEPFRPDAETWEIPSPGPLSGANGALPWILFHRDRERFENEFPEWPVASIEPLMPLTYLFSGGVSMRALCPEWMYGPCRVIERALGHGAAMFALIALRRTAAGASQGTGPFQLERTVVGALPRP